MSLPLAALFQYPTVGQLARLLRQEDTFPSSPRIYPIKTTGGRPPFFCVFAHLFWRRIAGLLGPDRPFYGVALSADDRLDPPYCLEDMAACLAGGIREVQPRGPYFLGGWCLDGLVALETARTLQRQGEQTGLLVLFDTPAPDFWENLTWRESARLRLWLSWQRLRDYWDTVRHLPSRRAARARNIAAIRDQAVRRYRPASYAGHVALFTSAARPGRRPARDARSRWAGFVLGELEVHEIPGNHATMFFKNNAEILARKLASSLARAEARFPRSG